MIHENEKWERIEGMWVPKILKEKQERALYFKDRRERQKLKPLKRGKTILYPACRVDKKEKLLNIKEFVDTTIPLAEVEDWEKLHELKFNVELALEAFDNPKNIIDGIVYATYTKCSVIKNLIYNYTINI